MAALPSSRAGVALPPLACHELIENVLRYYGPPTTIVVCSSREAFLESLHLSLQTNHSTEDSAEHGRTDASIHPLLLPTIHQLATSRTIDVAFAPTLAHLRAYLASYIPPSESKPTSTAFDKPGSHVAMLVVYGLLELHRTTTEYSVQGLSRTLAVAVEAANLGGVRLTLVEAPQSPEPPANESMVDVGTTTPRSPWGDQIPLLNSSLTLSNHRAWAGRTVGVAAVIARWCRIAET